MNDSTSFGESLSLLGEAATAIRYQHGTAEAGRDDRAIPETAREEKGVPSKTIRALLSRFLYIDGAPLTVQLLARQFRDHPFGVHGCCCLDVAESKRRVGAWLRHDPASDDFAMSLGKFSEVWCREWEWKPVDA